jgi:arylsulfatase A-like enzyme
VVVFTSDHGEMMGSHNLMYKNQIYEESFGVPFLIRYPRKIAAGSRDDILLGAPDVMPTVLGLMGMARRIPDAVEGGDHSGAVLGRSSARPDSALYLHIHPTEPTAGRRGLRTYQHTFAIERGADGERIILYDNESDRYQMKNVADENSAVVADLTGRLKRELSRIGDPWAGA